MTADSPLEELLRSTALKHGRICIYTQDGEWYASVSHFDAHQTHNVRPQVGAGQSHGWHVDPVDALRATLVEDDRRSRDLERRYAAAPKQGAVADDFEDMFG